MIKYTDLNMDTFLMINSQSRGSHGNDQGQVSDVIPIVSEKKINMNDMFIKKVTEEPDLLSLDKKIEMRYLKDGKAYRTFVFNLEHFIKEKKELDVIIHGIKKTFGTSCKYKETDFGYGYGFAGDCSTKVKRYLIDKKVVTAENFK